MFSNNSISISVSDSDSDSVPTRMKVRARRKHRRHRPTLRLLFRTLRRWWPVFLFLPAVFLLVFEASSIRRTDHRHITTTTGSVKPTGNLDRLDPTTKMIAGVRKRCLELLPDEELEHLDIPMDKKNTGPVQKVVYISENDSSYIEQTVSLSQEQMEVTRFNSFTGYQTQEQREKSFKVNETAAVHCGFYSENGGYKISDKDKDYLQTCKAAVSTCAFGGGDNLYQPIGMSQASLEKVCYVAFWDEITLAAQEVEGRRIGENQYIGKWRIVIVRNLPFRDQRLNGKIPKVANAIHRESLVLFFM